MGNKVHHGRNIKRIREILGMKQEALALEMGEDWNQRKISLLEQKDEIDDPTLEEVAKGLKVSVDAIKNYNEDATFTILANTYNDQSASVNYYCNINPVEKWLEAIEENKKLYERLLQAEKEKVEMLEKILNEKEK